MSTRPSLRALIQRLKRLERIGPTLGDLTVGGDAETLEREALRVAPRRVRQLCLQLRNAVIEATDVADAFAVGLNHSDPQRPNRLARLSPHRRGTVGFRIVVLFLAGELEYFFRELTMWWLTPREIATVRARRLYARLAVDDTKARDQLIRWTKPSAPMSSPRWSTRIGRLFRVRIDEPVSYALQTLILWRHETHPSRPAVVPV